MSRQEGSDATIGPGGSAGLQDAMAALYTELRRVAGRQMAGERAEHTLQPTAVVNEAYARLAANPDFNWQNQAHFTAIAAGVMRQVLVDYARRHRASKRGGDAKRVTFYEDQVADSGKDVDLLALDAAITKLHDLHPELARLIELRFFGGLNHAALMAELNLSRRALDKNWAFAKAWLTRELG